MRLAILVFLSVLPAYPALAHLGHVAEVAGHNHWVAGAAVGGAIAIAVWGALKGRKTKDDDPAEPACDADDAEPQEG